MPTSPRRRGDRTLGEFFLQMIRNDPSGNRGAPFINLRETAVMSDDPWKTSMDQWLSPEVGKGPPDDDAWRKRSGLLRPAAGRLPGRPPE